jgi:integrase
LLEIALNQIHGIEERTQVLADFLFGAGRSLRSVSGSKHATHTCCPAARIIEIDPAQGVRQIASNKRQRRLSEDEIRHLGRVMHEAGQEGEHPIGLRAIRFMLMTGFRRMEVLGLEWPWFSRKGHCIRFPDTKSGPQLRMLGEAAMDCLECVRTRDDSPFVFPADVGDGHFIGVARVLHRVCAKAKLDDVTPHTLRHTFASVAGDLGFSELTIAGMLGHSARGVTQRYVHLDKALIVAANEVAAAIAGLLDGETALSN